MISLLLQHNGFSQIEKISTLVKTGQPGRWQGWYFYIKENPKKYILPKKADKNFEILSFNGLFSALCIKDIPGETTIYFDRNLNKNFTDDKPVKYLSDSLSLQLPQDHLDSFRYINKWYRFSYTMQAPAYLKIAKNEIYLGANTQQYYVSSNNNLKHNIYIFNLSVPLKKNLSFVFVPVETDSVGYSLFDADMVYRIGDTVIMQHALYILRDFNTTTNELTLFKIKNTNYGYYKGYKLPNIIQNDVFKRPFSFTKFRSKYLLIDFWGTWCQPCIAGIPDLKKIAASSKNIQVVGIAYDKKEKVVKEFALKNNMTWPIIFDNEDDTFNLCKKFNVAQFPTYILIDTDHKILFRETGADGLEKIKEYIFSNIENTGVKTLNK